MKIVNTIDKYSVVVIGAGHAGVEAALAAARLNEKVLLLTLSLDSIAFMACNPHIGGTAKGHLVREIDALGGEMGVNADKSLLQIKMLNSAKGPAVFSLRGQADKNLYHSNMKLTLERQKNLDIRQGNVVDILTEDNHITGVVTSLGEKFLAKSVVIATGVYLNSKIIIGEFNKNIGPNGFENSMELTPSLIKLGIPIVRFKTGTPARVNKNTIDFSVMEEQLGDDDVYSFSIMTDEKVFNKKSCYLTYTNEETHKIIRENIDRSPLYNGSIISVGPRYCPSIETKVMKFADKERHQLFVEPEGENSDEYYVAGMSSSLPIDVQDKMYHTIKGLEHVQIMRYAYAIEYDCIDPVALTPYLMLKNIKGLFSAGQMNGSSGYEEAAAQGLIAGINASRYNQNKEPFTLRRNEAYIGVLIDDLVTKGTNEPYRMMTARAEYRLYLRQDNADVRLTQKGYDIGLVTEERYKKYLNKLSEMSEINKILENNVSYKDYGPLFDKKGEPYRMEGMTFKEILKRVNITFKDIMEFFSDFNKFNIFNLEAVEIEIKYAGYIAKQELVINEAVKLENKALPSDIDYTKVEGLRLEAQQKLNTVKPLNIGQASRISGVNSADITVLLVHLVKNKKKE